MASGHVNRIKRPNTWLHRPMLQNVKKGLANSEPSTHLQPCPQFGRFSNRPVGVKHFQAIHHGSVDVSHGLALLFGIGTWALPSWDPRTTRNNLTGALTV